MAMEETIVDVADFGSIPGDGKCDVKTIRSAIESCAGKKNIVIKFGPGVYNLKEDAIEGKSSFLATLYIWNQEGWTLRGAVDSNGNPATTLEMNLKLGNTVTGASHLDIRKCKNLSIENFVFDQNPRFATSAEVININREKGIIRIRIFEGMPHFDGMASFSANNWDLKTRLLIPGPPITIGFKTGLKYRWKKISGTDRIYELRSKEISKLLKEGQGLSFHFNVIAGKARCIDAYENQDIRFENIFMHNVIGMGMGAGDNRNMTFRRFHIKPEGSSLAVGPRDGIHITRSTGELLMDDVMVKGVRWDPLVSYLYFVPISRRIDEHTIELNGSSGWHSRILRLAEPGSWVQFWSGKTPSKGTVSRVDGDRIVFATPLAAHVKAGRTLSPQAWFWEKAVIKNSLIEANYGTALVFESSNLSVEDCTFRNNSYSNIGLGPTSKNVGVFSENIVIRNNLFEDSTWEQKYSNYRGTITTFNKNPLFSKEPYHQNILIEKNTFKNIRGKSRPSAIHIKNASGVVIRNNSYEDVDEQVIVEDKSTQKIIRE